MSARRCFRFTGAGALGTWAGAVLSGLLLLGARPAAATAVIGTGLPTQAARQAVAAAPTTGADAPTLDLVSGRIDAVAPDGSSITVRGRAVPLHPERLQVLGTGGVRYTSAQALRPGMQVRFALEPQARTGTEVAAGSSVLPAQALPAAATAVRRIVLIYIDTRP